MLSSIYPVDIIDHTDSHSHCITIAIIVEQPFIISLSQPCNIMTKQQPLSHASLNHHQGETGTPWLELAVPPAASGQL